MLWLKSVLISWTCWIKVQLNSIYLNFQDLWNKCSFISWQLRDKKTCASWWELEKRLCGLKEGWVEVIRQTMSFLLARVCLWGGGWAGWALLVIKCCSSSKLVTLIFHDHLQYCKIFLDRFLISFVFIMVAIAFGF